MGCCDSNQEKPKKQSNTSSCCDTQSEASSAQSSSACCPSSDEKKRFDWLLWGSSSIVLALCLYHLFTHTFTAVPSEQAAHAHSTGHHGVADSWLAIMADTSLELMLTMWPGIVFGILAMGLIHKIPREFVMHVLGTGQGLKGIWRATLAGLLLDLCNHGILMVASKLYERGASMGQVSAFLIASPWNSFSLTLILITLIGLPWTIAFILLSMLIGIVTGLIFDALEKRQLIPSNPNTATIDKDYNGLDQAKRGIKNTQFNRQWFSSLLINGIKDSGMIIRWLMLGVIIAALIRAFVPADMFAGWFGPTFTGLMLTIVAATIIEVCSEGSTPIAADLLNRASAPGNGFAFLMAGAATDYTEMMVMKDTTKSWLLALLIPIISLPQVILVSWIINTL